MSGPPRVRSINVSDPDHRPILGPAGNKARSVDTRKPNSKPQRKVEKPQEIEGKAKRFPSGAASPRSPSQCGRAPVVLRHLDQLSRPGFSMSTSCSSDASSDSSHSRASTGKSLRQSGVPARRKQCSPKTEKVEIGDFVGVLPAPDDASTVRKTCAWITPNTDPCYAAFHDGEWGVPVHDDKKLFELLSLSSALAELPWPAILNKRHLFREVFFDFDPVAVSKLNEKKIAMPGSSASSLLSELKLRAIIENARQMCKIMNEFGPFDKYIWGFVNHKPIVSQFRYPRQIPVKTSKAELISKDLVKRGFRGVGPTVVYSFMQVAGLTNDHLTSCFRFQECIAGAAEREKHDGCKAKVDEEEQLGDKKLAGLEMERAMDELSFSSD